MCPVTESIMIIMPQNTAFGCEEQKQNQESEATSGFSHCCWIACGGAFGSPAPAWKGERVQRRVSRYGRSSSSCCAGRVQGIVSALGRKAAGLSPSSGTCRVKEELHFDELQAPSGGHLLLSK